MNLDTPEQLTQKEEVVLKLVAMGWSSPQIAKYLNNSERTIENHRTNIRTKFDLQDRREYFKLALAEGLLAPEIETPRDESQELISDSAEIVAVEQGKIRITLEIELKGVLNEQR